MHAPARGSVAGRGPAPCHGFAVDPEHLSSRSFWLLFLVCVSDESVRLLKPPWLTRVLLCLRQNPQPREGLGGAHCQSCLQPVCPHQQRLWSGPESVQWAHVLLAAGLGESWGLGAAAPPSVLRAGGVLLSRGFLCGPGEGRGGRYRSVPGSLNSLRAEPLLSPSRNQTCC